MAVWTNRNAYWLKKGDNVTLTDTAEYWNDVDEHYSRKRYFVHIEGVECGHYHTCESSNVTMITCRACKEALKNDEALREKMNKLEKKREKRRRYKRNKRQRDKNATPV